MLSHAWFDPDKILDEHQFFSDGKATIICEPLHVKTNSMGYRSRSDTNQAVQP